MTGPEFKALHPCAELSTLRYWDGESYGPVLWRVVIGDAVIERPDKRGVLADIHAELML